MNDRAQFDDPHLESLLPKVPFTRRGFIASSLASGFALAAGPVAAQTAIITPADGLDVGAAQVPVSGGGLPVYFAAPRKAGNYATVIVIPEVFGMHEYQRDICRRLAKAGYYAITLDPFFRIGDLSKIADIKEVIGKANTLADEQMLSDLDALVAFVENQPKANTKKLGITGMCRGGRTVWMYTAHNNKIKAGVSWYGGPHSNPPPQPRPPVDLAGKFNAPVLGLYGGADQGISPHAVQCLPAALFALRKDPEAVLPVYQGTAAAL